MDFTPYEKIEYVEYLMQIMQEMMEKEVYYTGAFRFYGKAVVAECLCAKCNRPYWINYTTPIPYCTDCE